VLLSVLGHEESFGLRGKCVIEGLLLNRKSPVKAPVSTSHLYLI
jgi:hypothetical protein